MKWPPYTPTGFGNHQVGAAGEEVKGDDGNQINNYNAMDRYLRFEMGFSLVVKEMID